MKACIAQINYYPDNINEHIAQIKKIIYDHQSCDLIVFPELILHGHPSLEKPEGLLYRKVMQAHSSISKDLYNFVKETKARVIIGELNRQGERYYNVATYIDKNGVQDYSKTHVHWTENFLPGREIKVFDTPLGKIGITICFDAAFPEVWRVLALRGAEIIVNIAAVPKTFPIEYMWRRMIGGAIFNQVFVIYVNRPSQFFSGHSAVFNPMGEKLMSLDEKEAVKEVDIDLSVVNKWRKIEPLYSYRRSLLYREITQRRQKKSARNFTE